MSEVGLKIVGMFEIGKLRMRPGDVLVIKTDRPVSPSVAKQIREHIAPLLPPQTKVLVINPDIDLAVLTKSDIEGRVA